MSFYLPVPSTPQDVPDASAAQWEQAAPTNDHLPTMHVGGGSVTLSRTGPGDIPNPRDEWLDPDIFVVPRQGVMNGRQLFVEVPGPPPEGHGGYDPFNDPPKIDHSTRTLAIFWSDWNATVQQQQMRGEHVVIQRVPPGSIQGYMPTGMEQDNNQRTMPAPWDSALTIGAAIG